MRLWFIVPALAFAGVHAQQGLVTNIPSSCNTVCTVLESLGSTDPATLCTGDVRDNLQRCLSCILIIGGKAITSDLMTSGQSAADAFTKACGDASYKLDPILFQKPANPSTSQPASENGVSRGAAVGVSGLAFVWGVTMLLL